MNRRYHISWVGHYTKRIIRGIDLINPDDILFLFETSNNEWTSFREESLNNILKDYGKSYNKHFEVLKILNNNPANIFKAIFKRIRKQRREGAVQISIDATAAPKTVTFMLTFLTMALSKNDSKIKLLYTPKDPNEYHSQNDVLENWFTWNKIPGEDKGKLIEYLKQKFDIDWVETANIEKIDDDKIIRITQTFDVDRVTTAKTEAKYDDNIPRRFISLKIDTEKNKMELEIDDDRKMDFTMETKNDEIKILKTSNIDVDPYYYAPTNSSIIEGKGTKITKMPLDQYRSIESRDLGKETLFIELPITNFEILDESSKRAPYLQNIFLHIPPTTNRDPKKSSDIYTEAMTSNPELFEPESKAEKSKDTGNKAVNIKLSLALQQFENWGIIELTRTGRWFYAKRTWAGELIEPAVNDLYIEYNENKISITKGS
jgi:hypothetical protein